MQAAGVPGGLHDERESDEEIRNVVRSIHPELERASKQSFQSLEPIRYRKQVVAGANYFVKVGSYSGEFEKFIFSPAATR